MEFPHLHTTPLAQYMYHFDGLPEEKKKEYWNSHPLKSIYTAAITLMELTDEKNNILSPPPQPAFHLQRCIQEWELRRNSSERAIQKKQAATNADEVRERCQQKKGKKTNKC